LALSASVESAGNDAWDVQQNLPRSIENYSKDGLSILIQLLQMAGNEGGMEYPGICFVDGNLKEKIYGV
jgi:hypothetical protein